jgi:hypothetical protein
MDPAGAGLGDVEAGDEESGCSEAETAGAGAEDAGCWACAVQKQ